MDKDSREVGETAYIPSERASKIMVVHIEFVSFDELEPEISWIKGGPGKPAGGTPSRQSGGHLLPGGECFAPRYSDPIEGSKLQVDQRPKSRGNILKPSAGRTTTAPVLATGGKPSTRLPPGTS